jgi:hypothetical protein
MKTRKWVESSTWAQDFMRQNPGHYEEAIELVMDPALEVVIAQRDETGEELWAIIPVSSFDKNDEFWLDARFERQECFDLCIRMGWKVKNGWP